MQISNGWLGLYLKRRNRSLALNTFSKNKDQNIYFSTVKSTASVQCLFVFLSSFVPLACWQSDTSYEPRIQQYIPGCSSWTSFELPSTPSRALQVWPWKLVILEALASADLIASLQTHLYAGPDANQQNLSMVYQVRSYPKWTRCEPVLSRCCTSLSPIFSEWTQIWLKLYASIIKTMKWTWAMKRPRPVFFLGPHWWSGCSARTIPSGLRHGDMSVVLQRSTQALRKSQSPDGPWLGVPTKS